VYLSVLAVDKNCIRDPVEWFQMNAAARLQWHLPDGVEHLVVKRQITLTRPVGEEIGI